MSQDRKLYCLQAGPCIFQPGNVTGWGSEGVKNVVICIKFHGLRIYQHNPICTENFALRSVADGLCAGKEFASITTVDMGFHRLLNVGHEGVELTGARKTSHKHINKDLIKSPMVMITWHTSKYRLIHQRYILKKVVQCCFTSRDTIRLIRDGKPRTATWTFA